MTRRQEARISDALGPRMKFAVVAPSTNTMPVGDQQVRQFFGDWPSRACAARAPTLIAHVDAKTLRDAVNRVDDEQVEAIVQLGTNLAFAHLAPMAELWLDKPALTINTATWWWALRSNGIDDPVFGFGSLLEDY